MTVLCRTEMDVDLCACGIVLNLQLYSNSYTTHHACYGINTSISWDVSGLDVTVFAK